MAPVLPKKKGGNLAADVPTSPRLDVPDSPPGRLATGFVNGMILAG